MVTQILSHTGQIVHHWQTHLVEVAGGANPRQQHDLWRANGAGTEDNLVGFSHKYLTAGLDFNANCFLALEYYSAGGAIGPNRQIQSVPGRVQVAQSSAEPDTIGIVERNRANPRGLRVVVVGTFREARRSAGRLKRCLVRVQLILLEPSGDYRSVATMKIIFRKVGIRLNLPKI